MFATGARQFYRGLKPSLALNKAARLSASSDSREVAIDPSASSRQQQHGNWLVPCIYTHAYQGRASSIAALIAFRSGRVWRASRLNRTVGQILFEFDLLCKESLTSTRSVENKEGWRPDDRPRCLPPVTL
eukprot:358084-Chlamydomonas_euryale.AAC.5